MINDNQKKINKLQILMDACIIVISYFLAYYLRFYVSNKIFDFFKMGVNVKWYPLNVYTDKLMFLVPVYLILYALLNLYTSIHNKHRLTEVFRIILANILGIVLFYFALYFQYEINISRKFGVVFLVINVVLGVGSRILYSYCWKIMHQKNKLIS